MSKLVVTSKVKEVTKLRTSGDLIDALDAKVEAMLKEAEKRAEANGRSTVRPCDL